MIMLLSYSFSRRKHRSNVVRLPYLALSWWLLPHKGASLWLSRTELLAASSHSWVLTNLIPVLSAKFLSTTLTSAPKSMSAPQTTPWRSHIIWGYLDFGKLDQSVFLRPIVLMLRDWIVWTLTLTFLKNFCSWWWPGFSTGVIWIKQY